MNIYDRTERDVLWRLAIIVAIVVVIGFVIILANEYC